MLKLSIPSLRNAELFFQTPTQGTWLGKHKYSLPRNGDLFAGDWGSFLKAPQELPMLASLFFHRFLHPRLSSQLGTKKLTPAGPAAPPVPPKHQPSHCGSHGFRASQRSSAPRSFSSLFPRKPGTREGGSLGLIGSGPDATTVLRHAGAHACFSENRSPVVQLLIFSLVQG